MTHKSEWLFEESLDLSKLIKGIYEQADIYVSKSVEQSIVNKLTLTRCHKCHSLIRSSDYNTIFIFKDYLTLSAICNKCVKDIFNNEDHLASCEGCGFKYNNLYIHHWFEPYDNRVNTREICQSCNTKLIARKLWANHPYINLGDHVLPDWGLQISYLKNNLSEYISLRDIRYPITMA